MSPKDPRRSMKQRVRRMLEVLQRLLGRKPEAPPEDPYAYVTAPKRPRSPQRSAAVAVMEERDR